MHLEVACGLLRIKGGQRSSTPGGHDSQCQGVFRMNLKKSELVYTVSALRALHIANYSKKTQRR